MLRLRKALAAAALSAAVITSTAGWAADEQPLPGPPAGVADWRSDGSAGAQLPDPVSAAPREVAGFFDRLGPDAAHRLALRHPAVVGNLDGAPLALRYEANRLAAVADPRFSALAGNGGRVLAFDPQGRGRAVEVFGDLEHARHVAVIVPGTDTDAGSSKPAVMAKALQEASGNTTAVIAWTGYTTPVGVGLDTARGRLAADGANRLARFVEGLEAVGAPVPAFFCHSYGSVVCGLAASRLDATDLVFVGSPGVRADNVSDLHTRARVWAAKSRTDWISRMPNVEFAGLGHGPDPTSPSFGARLVPTGNVTGHGGYFTPGATSLATFARIAEGDAA